MKALERTQGNLAWNSDSGYLECGLKGRVWVSGGYMPQACGFLGPWGEMQSRRTRVWLAAAQGLVQSPGGPVLRMELAP